MAIIPHGAGPTASTHVKGNEGEAQKAGFNIVLKEGNSATAPICRRW